MLQFTIYNKDNRTGNKKRQITGNWKFLNKARFWRKAWTRSTNKNKTTTKSKDLVKQRLEMIQGLDLKPRQEDFH